MLTIKRILGTEITSIKRNRKARCCFLIFGATLTNYLSCLASWIYSSGILHCRHWTICCWENLQKKLHRKFASLHLTCILCIFGDAKHPKLGGILIVLVLPFKKWKLKCFSWQLVNSVCQNVLDATGKIRFFVLCGYIRLALVWNVEVVRETFSWRKITNRCRPKSALEKDKFSTWSLVNHNQNSTKLILFVTCCFNCFSLSWFSTDYISSQEFI